MIEQVRRIHRVYLSRAVVQGIECDLPAITPPPGMQVAVQSAPRAGIPLSPHQFQNFCIDAFRGFVEAGCIKRQCRLMKNAEHVLCMESCVDQEEIPIAATIRISVTQHP